MEGMKYMTSTSGNDGSSTISVTFDITRDVDLASVDVQNRVNSALGRLPNEVKTTGITITKSASGFRHGRRRLRQARRVFQLVHQQLHGRLRPRRLEARPGVGDVIIFGERKYSMRLWLDPLRMASRGLTATTFSPRSQEQNVQVASGQVGQPSFQPQQMYQMSVRALGRLADPAAFDDIILKTGTDGTLVRVRDVGRSELGAELYGSTLSFDGHDAVGFGVTQLPASQRTRGG